MKLIDLSHPFDPALYHKRPDQQAELDIRSVKTLEEHHINSLKITIGNHVGTHIDSPLHLVEGGASIADLPLERFYGSAAILDIPKGPNSGVSAADLEAAQPTVEPGDIVIIATGWGDLISEPRYASHHPFLTEDGARWLVDYSPRLVGMDVQSVDLPHALRPPGFAYTSLRILLEHGVPTLHSVTNLGRISGMRLMVSAFPIAFADADGAPARVVAQLND